MYQQGYFHPKFYLGLRLKEDLSDGEVHRYKLGFLTPWGNTVSAKKRMATVDSWVNDVYGTWDRATGTFFYPAALPTEIIDNTPLLGFKIADMVRRNVTKNVVWRVVDPRGFETEITSQNISYIIEESGIAKHGILDVPCVWGRVGASNWLIPEGTTYWKEFGLKD